MASEAMSRFKGIFVALVTPMTADEEVDLDALGAAVEAMISRGVHGIAPLGTTGEYYALSPDERRAVVERVVRAAAGRAAVMVGVNAGSTREVIAYAREAERLGADGLLLACPYYSLPTPDELVEHIRTVDANVGVPIMLYNYPARTGVDMTVDILERLVECGNVRYIKESTGDPARMTEIAARLGDAIALFCGCDTLAVEAFEAGAVGWVSGAANVLPDQLVELYVKAAEQKDIAGARAVFERMRPVLELLENGGKYTQLNKAGCGMMGRPAGPPRRPLLAPNDAESAALEQALALFR